MARDILAVPATGAGCEREFSIAGKVATSSRTRIDRSIIQETMMYKNHLLRHGQSLSFMRGAEMKLGEECIEEGNDGIPTN